MRYLNKSDISAMGISWNEIIAVITDCTRIIKDSDYSQPIKPYLRYHDPKNRIIAMPAFVGGDIQAAGIKWIASFPCNIEKKMDRAHSVFVLNEATTGKPIAFINTALLSAIRTAGVTGFVAGKYISRMNGRKLQCGIIGFGPIGKMHLRMLLEHFADYIGEIAIYDIRGVDVSMLEEFGSSHKIVIKDTWTEVFEEADLLITCTVSTNRYIDLAPRKGACYLNVSLRDFSTTFISNVDIVIVDDWDEVCRENTDVELAYREKMLKKEDTYSITDLLDDEKPIFDAASSCMFNPMGMAVYDMALAKYYYERSFIAGIGAELSDC
jgi:ornithine cyclodeaminase